ncbi:hypothetical protein SAMN05920897_11075 [Alkalispirochaeta americana]|uniref:DUF4174 domain-containing protein n=1 Tax=Alkalispirochaeta americana TaxID=159291 RepID=A0A1N6TIR8_9SPIO|nr:hypothetical protein [Alkalispirochaeta americana]SIQ53171.1 hypothetical protein SAMN05920897_11075 [Alkalispirochaeta americana]
MTNRTGLFPPSRKTFSGRSSPRRDHFLPGLVLSLLLLSLSPLVASGETPGQYLPELALAREGSYLLLLLAEDQNDDRLFEVHLALSNRWDALTRRKIQPLDILPRRHDVTALARLLGVQGSDFALVLLNHQGDVLFRSTDPARALEALPAVDADRRRE